MKPPGDTQMASYGQQGRLPDPGSALLGGAAGRDFGSIHPPQKNAFDARKEELLLRGEQGLLEEAFPQQ